MYATGHTLSISPRESEIPLILSTKTFPDQVGVPFRACDLSFPITPRLQLSNAKWSIGLKGLTLPSRLINIDSSFKVVLLVDTAI